MLGKLHKTVTTVTKICKLDIAAHSEFEFVITYVNDKFESVELLPKSPKIRKEYEKLCGSDYSLAWYLLNEDEFEIVKTELTENMAGITEIQNLKEGAIEEVARNRTLYLVAHSFYNGYWFDTHSRYLPFAVRADFGSKRWDLPGVKKHLKAINALKTDPDIKTNPVWENHGLSGYHEYAPIILVKQEHIDMVLPHTGKYCSMRDYFVGGLRPSLLKTCDPLGILPFAKEDIED
ncbi:MAG: hypothetical protein KDD50_15640 [Bdellovibrionales bacterium]|nr:hypothetical protein [Bdellovibrionales bacterium]